MVRNEYRIVGGPALSQLPVIPEGWGVIDIDLARLYGRRNTKSLMIRLRLLPDEVNELYLLLQQVRREYKLLDEVSKEDDRLENEKNLQLQQVKERRRKELEDEDKEISDEEISKMLDQIL